MTLRLFFATLMVQIQYLSLMSEEQLKAFIAKVKDDPSIQEKLKAAKTPEDVVGIAKEYSYEFTADTVSDLSDEELEEVSGGTTCVYGPGCSFMVQILICLQYLLVL